MKTFLILARDVAQWERIISAIQQLRGVSQIEPVHADVGDRETRDRTMVDLEQKMLQVIRDF